MGRGGRSSGQEPRAQRTAQENGSGGNFSELANRLNGYGIVMAASDFETAGLNYDTVASGVDGITQVMDDFPILRGLITTLKYDGNMDAVAYAQYNPSMNGVTLAMCSDFRLMPALFNSMMSRGTFHPANQTAASTMAHEVGHALETALCTKKYSDSWDAYQARRNGTEANRILAEAMRVVNRASGVSKSLSELRGSVSQYATHNVHETIAECFGDVFANGANANPFSRAVYDIMRRELS